MLLSLLSYLYKFKLKPHSNKSGLVTKRPHVGMVLQPVKVKQSVQSQLVQTINRLHNG